MKLRSGTVINIHNISSFSKKNIKLNKLCQLFKKMDIEKNNDEIDELNLLFKKTKISIRNRIRKKTKNNIKLIY